MPQKRNAHVRRSPAQEMVERMTSERFAFLVEQKGYTTGAIDRSFYATMNYYLGPRIGVRVIAQFNRDTSVLVDIIRTEAGQLPQDWNTLRVSRRWSSSMVWLLRDAPMIPHEQLDQVMDLYKRLDPSDPATYDLLIAALGDLLKRSIDYLAAQPYELLFPA